MSGGAHQDRVVRAVVAQLCEAGVTDVVVAPGSRSTPLVQAVAELEALGAWTLQVVLDERSAAFLATGLARGGRLPLVVCTSGTAVAHLLPACVESGESGLGWVVLSGDRPAALQDRGAPQTIRQRGLLEPYAPCLHIEACEVALGDAWQAELRHRVQGPLRAPVHLNIGLDLPLAMGTEGAPTVCPQQGAHATRDGRTGVLPPPQMGERVLVVAGPMPPHTVPAAVAANLAAQAVVLHEVTANLPTARTFACYDAILRDPTVRERLLPDRIVRLGEWPASKGLQLLLETAVQRGIAVDVLEGPRRSDPLACNRLTVNSPPAVALAAWHAGPHAEPQVAAWRNGWLRAERAARMARDTLRGELALQETEGALVPLLLHACARRGAALLLGNSMPLRDADGFAADDLPSAVYSIRGANGIDGNLATALGLAEALAPRPLLVYLGDGALLHDIGALQLFAQRVDVQVEVVVADNDGGAIFDYLPARTALAPSLHNRCFTAPHGLDLAAVARGFGVETLSCSCVADAAAVLATQPERSRVIVVRIDRERSLSAHRAWQRVQQVAAASALQDG